MSQQQSPDERLNSVPDEGTDLLTAFLAARDAGCPRCQYNLRGLLGNRCPECGDQLTLQVGLVESRIGAFVLLVAAACAGLGSSLVFGSVAMIYAPASWWRKTSAIVLVATLVMSAAILAGAMLGRCRFRRAERQFQWRLAIGAMVLIVGAMILFIAMFRD